ncbi:MAG: phosphate ABC transporter ATP-binding protein [Armatimonadota bacterium]|nr:MAG: phosphate ABC transporter ATP-binding protein [Armatimonadota bacterium]
MPHISIRGLSVDYDGHPALRNVTVDIPDRQITAIIGPSGCGKTTLLKSCNRLLDLTDGVRVQGEVLIDGVNILDPRVDVTQLRKKMGLLFQKPYPLPMSIYENVAYGPRVHGLNDRRQLDGIVERCLKTSSLWEEVKGRLRSPATKLSVGQQQRLCLARALAVEPQVLLGDEPTSALDPQSAQQVEKRLVELKGDYTIVIVTHILRQAKRLADYVIFMYLGELVEHGPAAQVFADPRDTRTQAYLGGEVS